MTTVGLAFERALVAHVTVALPVNREERATEEGGSSSWPRSLPPPR
jgi:hypothetical protein